VTQAVLVGRDRDLADVAALVQPGGRRPHLVLVEGEAGIGKTSLVHAVASTAEAAGVEVRWGSGVADADASPYWLWRQVLRDLPVGLDRFELFARLHDALDGAVGLVVIDDIQLVDESSRSALNHLLRARWRSAPTILATRRTGDGEDAWRSAAATLLEGIDVRVRTLAGLDRAAVAVLGQVFGAVLDGTTADRLHADSRGNPLVLRELLEARVEGTRSSRGYSELVRARLRRLPPQAQEFACVAAAVGDPFDLVVASRAVGRGVAARLGSVTELVSAGLCRPVPDRPGYVAFAHALTRDAILESLSLQRRVALHRKVAEVLEALLPDGGGGRAAEIAGHRVAAAAAGMREPALRWSRVAAEEALGAGAWEEAVRLATRGLECANPVPDAATEAPLRTIRARAAFLLGRREEPLADVRRAHRLALASGRTDLAASAALALEPIFSRQWDAELRDLLTEALGALAHGDARLVARLHARLAQTEVNLKAYVRAAEHSAAALEVAGLTDDPDVLVDVLHARQLTLSGPEHVSARDELAESLVAVGKRLDRPDVELWGHVWAIDVAFQRGDLTRAEQEIAPIERCAERVGTLWARWRLLLARAAILQARGRFVEAQDAGRAAFDITIQQGRPVIGAFAALSYAIARHCGTDESILDRLGDIDSEAGEVNGEIFAYVGSAVAFAEAGRVAEAERLYRRAGDPRGWEIPPYFELHLLSTAAMMAQVLDDRDDMAWFRDRLRPFRTNHATSSAGTASYGGPLLLVLGGLDAALGDLEAAEGELTEAAGACAANGSAPFEVEARVLLAEVVARRGRLSEARAVMRQVRPAAERLGMVPWLARIDRALTADPVLTPREFEVARLVARGYGNGDIARELVLSERTAENHVQHILTKLGFRNRSQIAAWVASGQVEYEG
jgi:DNA-binding CsgD family transcriptional regulator